MASCGTLRLRLYGRLAGVAHIAVDRSMLLLVVDGTSMVGVCVSRGPGGTESLMFIGRSRRLPWLYSNVIIIGIIII